MIWKGMARLKRSKSYRIWIVWTAIVLISAWETPAYSAGEGPPLFEMPAWVVLVIGAFETLLVLAGLIAAWWLLSRRS